MGKCLRHFISGASSLLHFEKWATVALPPIHQSAICTVSAFCFNEVRRGERQRTASPKGVVFLAFMQGPLFRRRLSVRGVVFSFHNSNWKQLQFVARIFLGGICHLFFSWRHFWDPCSFPFQEYGTSEVKISSNHATQRLE
jgi:hypothetical protein